MGTDNTIHQLASQIGKRLHAAQLLLTTAESCTGGLVAAAITAIAGSGDWFDRGFVTYSVPAKIEMLGLAAAFIEQHGAVSESVARAMAEGALRHSRAHLALAITGLAGPTPGGEDKPVGTVCFAWCIKNQIKYPTENQIRCETMQFNGERQQVRAQAVEHALRGVLALLEE